MSALHFYVCQDDSVQKSRRVVRLVHAARWAWVITAQGLCKSM